MKFIQKNKKILLYITLLNLSFLVVWGLFFYLVFQEAELVAQKNRNITRLEEERLSGAYLSDFYNQTAAERNFLSSYFHDSESLISLIESIEAKARLSGVVLIINSVEVENSIKISLRVEGVESQVLGFLVNLEGGNFVSRFDGLIWESRMVTSSANPDVLVNRIIVQMEMEILSFEKN